MQQQSPNVGTIIAFGWPLMRLIVLIALLFFPTLALSERAPKSNADEVIKIALIEDLVPYSFIDQHGTAQGFLVDYWRLWAEKSNHNIKFVSMPLRESVIALRNNEVQIHASLFTTQGRREAIRLIEPIYKTKSNVYFRRNDRHLLDKMIDLDGKTIGLFGGSSYDSYISTHYPLINIVRFNRLELLIDAIDDKTIDAFINESVTTWFMMVKALNFNKYQIISDLELTKNIYAAVARDNPALEALVRQGMANISVNEVSAIEQTWMISPYLRTSILSKREQQWLVDNPSIEIATASHWRPFIFLDASGRPAGYNVDLLALINKNIGTNFKIKRYQYWPDGLKDVQAKQVGGIFSMSWSKQRAKTYNFSPTYYFDPHHIIVRNDNQSIKRFEDIDTLRIAVVREFVLTDLLKSQLPGAKLIYVKDAEQAFAAIADAKADVGLFGNANQEQLARHHLKVVNSFYSKAGEYAIGSAKDNPILGGILAKGINSITALQKSTLINKWHRNTQSGASIFSDEELQYIAQHPVIKTGVLMWQPIIFTDGGEIFGIIGDLLSEISRISGLEFQPVSKNWQQLVADFKQHKIDLLPASYRTPQRQDIGWFGDGFLSLEAAIHVLDSNSSVTQFSDLNGRKLAIVAGDANIALVNKKYPDIDIVETRNIEASITLLLSGEVDALFEAQAIVAYLLKNSLIYNVKVIEQPDFDKRALYFWAAKDQPLLHSILNKAMRNISQEFKNKSVDNWIGDAHKKASINVGFGLGREPFTLSKSHLKGIEYDLLKRVFDAQSIKIHEIKKLPMVLLNSALTNYPQLDAVVTVKHRDDGYFYSNDFISFDNVVVSLAQQKRNFNSLSDLKGLRVMAFAGALEALGPSYHRIFSASKRVGLYQEVNQQEQQLNSLVVGEVDAIIIDKTILRWQAFQLGFSSLETFAIAPILSTSINTYGIAFRSRELRDVFNDGLSDLKESGEYQHIIDGYADATVTKKVALVSLISSLVASYIFNDDTAAITAISREFGTLPYVDKVEVYANDDVLLFENSNEKFNNYNQFDSFAVVNNITQKVGFVRVFFNPEAVASALSAGELIPEIGLFMGHRYYQEIRATYRRFGYLAPQIEFSPQEQQYLKGQPVLAYSEVTWSPLSIVDNDNTQGLNDDYMNIIAEKTGIKFRFKKYARWRDVTQAFSHGDLDFIPGVADLDEYRAMGLLSDQYAYFKFAIVMNSQASFVSDSNDLRDKKIAIPRGNSAYYYIKQQYPDAKVIEAKSINDALMMVRNGQVDAFVEHVAVAVDQLEHEFSDLKIAGLLDYGFSHRMMVKADEFVLHSILNKVIGSISAQQHQQIRDRWLRREVKTAVDYRLLYQVIAVFLLVLLLIFLVFKKFARAKKQIELAHEKLAQSFANLQQTQQQLVESEKMASLGGLVAGIAHEINTPVGIGLTAITHFLGISEVLEQKYQRKSMSQSDFEGYLKDSMDSAQIIHRNLEKTAQLVRSFKQISVDQSSDERRSFNICSYIQEIKLSIFHLTKKTNITIKVECANSIMIDSYPGALSQILSNLLINSTIHAYPNNEQGEIIIKVEVNGRGIKLTYLDDGSGIPAHNLSKIFNPFFTTNREYGGSGLGLNIIYNIVTNRLEGSITCRSVLGEFTEFVIEFMPNNIEH